MKHAIVKEQTLVYAQADRQQKGQILTAVMKITGMPRKSLIREFARESKRKQTNDSIRIRTSTNTSISPKLGRPRKYTTECETIQQIRFTSPHGFSGCFRF